MAVYQPLTREIPAYADAVSAPAAAHARHRLRLRGGLTVKLGLALTILFTAVLTLTHAQPYQNDDLRALIAPSANCAMPCWNHIQPGLTTADEAVALLRADPFVADYRVSPGQISWWWNGEQAALLDMSGRAFHGRIETALVNGQERVTSVVLDTTVLMGDVQLTLGDPESVTLYTVQPREAAQRAGIVYVANYHDLSVFTILDCPMNVADFWHAPGYIAIGKPNLTFDEQTYQYDALPDWFFRDQTPGCAVS
jgi:hypothetical protein